MRPSSSYGLAVLTLDRQISLFILTGKGHHPLTLLLWNPIRHSGLRQGLDATLVYSEFARLPCVFHFRQQAFARRESNPQLWG